ncbi:MAG: hypothetical protein ACREHG_05870 [Candidatus Saccharimonadales bacterium]
MDEWVIEVKGPRGVKLIVVPADVVAMYMDPTPDSDPYVIALWSAFLLMYGESTNGTD